MSEAVFRAFDGTDWEDETKAGRVSADVAEAARKAGAKRKFMATGEVGLFVQYSDLPPGYRIAAHSHSHSEVLYVLTGGCTVDGGHEMGPNDSAVVPGGMEYGITVGPEGMTFLTIRGGDAKVNFTGA
jgi:quercetin dioxygenase-like cupin family protein